MNTSAVIFEKVGQRLETCHTIQTTIQSLALLIKKQSFSCATDVI